MRAVPPDGLVVQTPNRHAALIALAVAGDEVAHPVGLKRLVELRVCVRRIVLDVHRIRGRLAIGYRLISARRIVLDAVAARVRMILSVRVDFALLAVLRLIETAHLLA